MRRLTTTAILLGAGLSLGGNALVNGDFEKGLDGWGNDGAATASVEHVQGELACVVRLPVAGWSGIHQTVAVPPGTSRAKVSGWLRADSVRGGKENWERGRLSVEFHNVAGDTVGGYPTAVGQARGRMPWTRMERIYEIPAGAGSLRIACALGNSSGTLHCDDLSVEFLP